MNKKISSFLAWEMILAFFVIAIGILWIENQGRKNEEVSAFDTLLKHSSSMPATKKCTLHAYQGTAKISGWLVEENQEVLFQVDEKDLASLPGYDGTEEFKDNNSKIKVIDMTKQMENKLKASSKENMMVFSLKGYLSRCQAVPLASINYKDGIFKPYLNL